LLDADVIINLYEMELWGPFKTAYAISVPSIVAREAKLYRDVNEIEHDIDVLKQRDEGITILNSSPEDLALVTALLSGDLKEGLGDGELQALALIHCGQFSDGLFCTCDALAIETLAALGYSERGVSLEQALNIVGYTLSARHRRRHFTQKYFQEHLNSGRARRIQRRGVIDSK